ncbi:helix-turn-helix domain-containing protein [Algoriphagus marincola]|uniref:Helix-turn-helix domain-containing protein n=1 Tax=Algoriphagus marincola TaxID=264027 RepID=A0ABS7N2H5_9BACT|nr:helix-turn-helix domain-containing protein [Algoriphagus marincola]MBY5950522.1 helix-turn-helix domain-containing protein [Algoriphagus marincola]
MKTTTSTFKKAENPVLNGFKALLEEMKEELLSELRNEFQSVSRFDEDKLIKPGEAAQRLGISTRTLKRYRDDNKIPYVQRGNLILYSEKEIQRMIQGTYCPNVPEPEPEIPRRGRPSRFNLKV